MNKFFSDWQEEQKLHLHQVCHPVKNIENLSTHFTNTSSKYKGVYVFIQIYNI